MFVEVERDTTGQAMFHGILSLITCGLWLPIGILIYACTKTEYMCKNCGEHLSGARPSSHPKSKP